MAESRDDLVSLCLKVAQRVNPLGWLTFGLIGFTLLLDSQTPLGVAVWIFYFPAIVTALFWKGRRAMVAVTFAVIVLAIVGFSLSLPGFQEIAIVNRLMFVVACGVFAAFCWWIDKTRSALAVLQERQKSEAQFRSLFTHSPVGMCLLDREGRYVQVNRTYCTLLGYSEEELSQQSFARMVYADDVREHQAFWDQCWNRSDVQHELEHRSIRKDGRIIWIKATVTATTIFGTETIRAMAIIQDITLRKQAEIGLKDSEERLKEAQRIAQVGSWELDLDTSVITWSDQIFRIFERDPAQVDISYEAFLDRVHPEDRDLVNEAYLASIEFRQPYEIVHRLLMADGRIKYVQERCETNYSPEGKPLRSVGTVQDITARKQAEEELKRSEAFISSVVDNLPNMVFVKDAEDLRFVRMNKAGEALLGYSHHELLGKSGYDFFPKEEADLFVAADRKVLASGQLLDIPEEHVQTREQGIRYLHTKKIPILDPGGRPQYLLGISEDITERRQMEDLLRQSHVELERRVFERTEELATAIAVLHAEVSEHERTEEALTKRKHELLTAQAQAHLGSWSWDIRTASNTWSDENYRIFGFEPKSIEPSYEVFAGALHDEDRERVLRVAQVSVEEGAPYDIECRIVRPSGEIRHVHCRGDVTRDEKGRPLRMAGTMLDVTERKRLEGQLILQNEELEQRVAERSARVRELEAQRAQTEKLAALGQLAAGVAHEINNPVAGIKNAFLVVKGAIPKDFPQYSFVGMIDREIDRVSNIVKQMYQLYRAEPRKHQPVDLTDVFHDLSSLVANRLAQRGLSLDIEMGPSVPRLLLPLGDLLQVLLNLINNAIDSSPEQTVITLTVREMPHKVLIGVTDRGSGIAAEVLPHIFDPFFTTKTAGPSAGLGLGLSVTHSLVHAMGGTIEVQSRVNEGSTFTVLLPLDNIEPLSSPMQLEEVSTHDR